MTPLPVDAARARRIIAHAVEALGLDLSGFVVLTEAASGPYVYTPLIAAAAGADRVLALTRDSRWGAADGIARETMALAAGWGLDSKVCVLTSRDDPRLAQADIVTNLGFVRPLDAAFLGRLGPDAVIPLMWESWEFRPEDLDLRACRQLGIPVMGTDEQVPELQIFAYVGQLAVKLLFELRLEVFRTPVVVLGSGAFGRTTVERLEKAGADVTLVEPERVAAEGLRGCQQAVTNCDAIVVVEHHSRRLLIGSNGLISIAALRDLNDRVSVAHIAGGIDADGLRAAGVPVVPAHVAPAGHMSVTAGYLGPRPVIDLHAAGLKVGELMASARRKGLRGIDAERDVLSRSSLAQSLSHS